MKFFKIVSFSLLMLIILTSFSQCSSTQKLQKKAPTDFSKVYFQRWTAGIKDGGSGIALYLELASELPKNIVLDSVYFRGKPAKLETKTQDSLLFIGYFRTDSNQKRDIIMSSNPLDEYHNKLGTVDENIPFELKDDECVISYKMGKDTKYFKIENIIEKEIISYPSTPNNKQ